jgi:hypothetical protein
MVYCYLRRMASRQSSDRDLRVCGLDEWRPGDLLIYLLHFCGVVALVGGVLLALLGVLGGSLARLDAPYDNLGLIERGGEIALAGAALWVASWALRRLLGRR